MLLLGRHRKRVLPLGPSQRGSQKGNWSANELMSIAFQSSTDELYQLMSRCSPLQKARVTSSEVRTPLARSVRSSAAEFDVISSSCPVNHPDRAGKPVTSSCESGGLRSGGISHFNGMDFVRAERLAAATCSQLAAIIHVGPATAIQALSELLRE